MITTQFCWVVSYSESECFPYPGQSQTMSSEQPAAGVEGEQKVADNKPEDIPSATEEDKESHSDGDKPTENDPEMQKDRDSEKPEETEVKQDEVAGKQNYLNEIYVCVYNCSIYN